MAGGIEPFPITLGNLKAGLIDCVQNTYLEPIKTGCGQNQLLLIINNFLKMAKC